MDDNDMGLSAPSDHNHSGSIDQCAPWLMQMRYSAIAGLSDTMVTAPKPVPSQTWQTSGDMSGRWGKGEGH